MSTIQRSPARLRPPERFLHPAVEAAPRSAVVQLNTPALTGSGFTALLERVAQEVLAVTYWFDPAPQLEPYPVTVRFSGRRVGVQGKAQPGDHFVQDETIKQVVPGSGPISLTAKIHGITPGEWVVTARILGSPNPVRGSRASGNALPAAGPLPPGARWWRRWAPSVESVTSVHTRLLPFARVPGILPGIWATLVTLGIVCALVLQSLVIAIAHLKIGSAWLVTLLGIAVGLIGAKGWFIVLHWRQHGLDRIAGWCIQGFIVGATLAAMLLLAVLRLSFGVFLDATAPGLLVAMAVGRVGCFFAGCCGGPPTASHWGVWSSDQRVGARRIPTQLLESALALSLGLGVLGAVLFHGPAGGAFFVGGLAAYTLGRQGILHLRAEPRKTRWGGLVIAALAALVLVATVVLLAQ